jgi:hypothetical protein
MKALYHIRRPRPTQGGARKGRRDYDKNIIIYI